MAKNTLLQNTQRRHIGDDLLYKHLPEGEWIAKGKIGRANERTPITLRDLYLYVRLNYHLGTSLDHIMDNGIFAGETNYVRWTVPSYDELLDVIDTIHRDFQKKPKYSLRQALKQLRRALAEPVIKGGFKSDIRSRDFMLREREQFVLENDFEPTFNELVDYSQKREVFIRGGYLETIVIEQAVRTTVDILVSLFVNALVITVDSSFPPVGHTTMYGGEVDHYLTTIPAERVRVRPPREWLTNLAIDHMASKHITSATCIMHPTTFCDLLDMSFIPGIYRQPKLSHGIVLNTATSGSRGEHWVFLGYHGRNKTLIYYDSGAGEVPVPTQEKIRMLFAAECIAHIKLAVFRSQYSNSECGIYVLLMAYYFATNQEDIILSAPIADISCYDLRTRMQDELRLYR